MSLFPPFKTMPMSVISSHCICSLYLIIYISTIPFLESKPPSSHPTPPPFFPTDALHLWSWCFASSCSPVNCWFSIMLSRSRPLGLVGTTLYWSWAENNMEKWENYGIASCIALPFWLGFEERGVESKMNCVCWWLISRSSSMSLYCRWLLISVLRQWHDGKYNQTKCQLHRKLLKHWLHYRF